MDLLPFVVIGLTTGAVYGLAGIGLVLTYKTSGIFNIGYGAIAAVGVYLFYFLHAEHGMAWPDAAAITLLGFAPLIGLALEFLTRSLRGVSEATKIVSTVGLILIVDAIGLLWHPTNPPTFGHFLPQRTVTVLGTGVTWEQIVVFSLSSVAVAALWLFFRSARLGILMRAVVDNEDLVSMSGESPGRVRRWAWVIGTIFACLAGLMIGPTQQVNGVALTMAVFAAFGAAAIGYFSSLPWTFAGGLLIGIASALVDKYAATAGWIGGLPAAFPFLILFVVLIAMPRSRLAVKHAVAKPSARRSYSAPVKVRLVAGAGVVALLACAPAVQAEKITLWSAALINMILFLSLGLLVRRSGQASLCHLAFAAVGAAAFSHFATDLGFPWLLALLAAMLVAIPVGAIVAIPAVRISGVYLALATLGFGILIKQVFYNRPVMFGATSLGIEAPMPDLRIGQWDLTSDNGFYYLLLVIAAGVVGSITLIANGRLGRLLEAMADAPRALEMHGTTTSVLKVIVFCLAASMAALAGALTVMLYQFGVGAYFEPFSSLTLIVLVIIVTVGEPWYALVAAIGLTVVPGYVGGGTTTAVLELLFGFFAITAGYGTSRGSMPAALVSLLDRLGGRKTALGAGAATIDRAAEPAGGPLREPITGSEPGRRRPAIATARGMEVCDLSVRFGGVKAVDGLSLRAPTGRITGLIGPNGAGKTTTFNACSGLVRPSAGRILLHGDDVTHSGPAARARRGLGRTFQIVELFDSLTVEQNVALGREAPMAGANPFTQLFGSRGARTATQAAAKEAMELAGIPDIAHVRAGLLPLGQRRLVELARVLAGPFDMLLLDEPSSGLDGHESHQFGQVLETVVDRRGCGVLLVEHDMSMISAICDYVYVLDFGKPIFDGTPGEMYRSDAVKAAYLGSEPAAAAPTGQARGELANRPIAGRT